MFKVTKIGYHVLIKLSEVSFLGHLKNLTRLVIWNTHLNLTPLFAQTDVCNVVYLHVW